MVDTGSNNFEAGNHDERMDKDMTKEKMKTAYKIKNHRTKQKMSA